MNKQFLLDTAERMGRTFFQGYLGAAAITGFNFDSLADLENVQIGVAAAVLSFAMAMGLKNVGPEKDSGSVL